MSVADGRFELCQTLKIRHRDDPSVIIVGCTSSVVVEMKFPIQLVKSQVAEGNRQPASKMLDDLWVCPLGGANRLLEAL